MIPICIINIASQTQGRTRFSKISGRNRTSRANQNGPKEYGFRGNAKNYDLNRDFIKTDTKNAETFSKIFHLVNLHISFQNFLIKILFI